MNQLVGSDDLGCVKNEGVNGDGLGLNLDSPILHGFLLEQRGAHALNLGDLLLGSDTGARQSISHSGTLSDRVRDTVEDTELRGQEVLVVGDLDSEKGLLGVSDLLLISLCEVFGDGNFASIVLEDAVFGVLGEVDLVDDVGSLVTPIGDDGLAHELKVHCVLELVLSVCLFAQLVDSVEARLSGHELEDIVDGESDANFRLEGRGLESVPHHEAGT